MIESCGTCRHYSTKERECRRNPPTAFPVQRASALTGETTTLSVLGIWPATRAENWCGEWEPRDRA